MTNAAANIIPAEWKSISLEAMNEKAAMQTRVDRKYIVDAETAAKVLSTLDADAELPLGSLQPRRYLQDPYP